MKKLLTFMLLVLVACGNVDAQQNQVGVSSANTVQAHGHSGPMDGGVMNLPTFYYTGATSSINSASLAVLNGDIFLACTAPYIVFQVGSTPTYVQAFMQKSAGTATLSDRNGGLAYYGLDNIASDSTIWTGTACVVWHVSGSGTMTITSTLIPSGGTVNSYVNDMTIQFIRKL